MREDRLPILIGALVCLALPSGQAIADDDDACRMFLCMAGKVQHGGAEADGCNDGPVPAIPSYFEIRVFDPEFDPYETAVARDQRIGQCSGILSDPSGRNDSLRASIFIRYGGQFSDGL